MLKDSPNLGNGTITLRDDPRVLPLGKILRRSKVNELPQLINVFLCQMSLIGPRPQTERCFNAFPTASQKAIIQVRPGLSGIGSIIFRCEDDMLQNATDPNILYDDIIMPYKGQLEQWYVKKRSFFINLTLIFLTVWVIIFPSSSLTWRLFPNLPVPPEMIRNDVNYISYKNKSR